MELKILIINSDEEVLSTLKSELTKQGFQIITSNNSHEAIKMAANERPQLVLLDLVMPELDGIDICLELKSIPGLQHLLIVFYTDFNEDYSQIAAFKAGADDYIIKPTKIRVLTSRLRALLKRSADNYYQKKPLDVTGLFIDRERYLIYMDNQEIVLPRKEFELLSLMYASPRKVFTRKEISDLIWGYEFVRKNRTIDVHIRKLREKLGDKYIKTIKGVGYSLEI